MASKISYSALESKNLDNVSLAENGKFSDPSPERSLGSARSLAETTMRWQKQQENDLAAYKTGIEDASRLPPFDTALGTRKKCFIGLGLSYFVSIALIICGSIAFVIAKQQEDQKLEAITQGYGMDWKHERFPFLWYPTVRIGSIGDGPKEVLILLFNSIVTATTENLGYIHATSLRWALYHEGRLHHNSNLRFFTSARKSAPNRWYCNMFWAFLLTMLYSCAAQSIVSVNDGFNRVGFNSLAVLLGGISLLLLNLLTTWPLLPAYQKRIVSWNSDPLNTALALRHLGSLQPSKKPIPRAPRTRQKSLKQLNPGAIFVVGYLWFLVPIVGAGVGVIFWSSRLSKLDSTFVTEDEDATPIFFWLGQAMDCLQLYGDYAPPDCVSWRAVPAINIFFIVAVQILYTLALHTLEQLVNLTRDEKSWQRAYPFTRKGVPKGASGAIVGRESTKAALQAWQTVFLLVMKPLAHWLLGLSCVVHALHYITFHPMPLITLGGIAMVLAVFAMALAFTKPKGPQPATYGNLSMIVEMVDDWGRGVGETLYWGDKGDDGTGLRNAGTSQLKGKVAEVRVDGVMYNGLATEEVLGIRRQFSKGWENLTWRPRRLG